MTIVKKINILKKQFRESLKPAIEKVKESCDKVKFEAGKLGKI